MSSPPSRRLGKRRLRAVLDTNIWVSAFINPNGAPGQVLQAVHLGAIDAIASWQLAEEVAEVLTRPRLANRYRITPADVEDVLKLIKPYLPDVDVEIELRDTKDRVVVASAIAGRAPYIVTGDEDLRTPDVCQWLTERRITVVTAPQLIELIVNIDF